MKTVAVCFLVAAAALGMATPSYAEIVQVDYTGTIVLGMDGEGLFGSKGSSLAGSPITIKYLFDTALGTPMMDNFGSMSSSGGTLFGNTSPALSASISVAGKTVTITGQQYGAIAEQSNPLFSFQSHEADQDDANYVFSSVTAASGSLPAAIANPFSYEIQPSDNAFGAFTLAGDTFGSFTPETIAESPAGAVPEPSTWVMMLVGLGGLGCAIGRRKSLKSFVTAANGVLRFNATSTRLYKLPGSHLN